MKILVTGAAGFIGFHAARKLLDRGEVVVGLDNLNPYYEPALKVARLQLLKQYPNFNFRELDIADRIAMEGVFEQEQFQRVIHLAAQAGVRYSIDHPHVYVESNVTGFLHILEGCRRQGVQHLVYASTSSVYGANTKMPFSERDHTDHPLTLYAATKRANELMAHSYSNLYGLPTTGLRFFTVYGPWGRPDMALFLFTKKILADEPIDVFNHGHHRRDFTYIDDIVNGVLAATYHTAKPDDNWDSNLPDSSRSRAPYRIYNIGNERPVQLLEYIGLIEKRLEKTAIKNLLPIQLGDVPDNWADVAALVSDVGYRPSTPVEVGVARFVNWYLEYYHPNGVFSP
jgi:UDP-glucuronate 4-epimerase